MQSIRQIPATVTKKKRRAVVVDDSHLRGTEDPVCQPNPSQSGVCCLPEVQARDIAERPPGLTQPNDCHPLLIVLVEGTRAQEGTRGGGLDSFDNKDECQRKNHEIKK